MRSVESAECGKYIKEKDIKIQILSYLGSQFFIELLLSVTRILTSC